MPHYYVILTYSICTHLEHLRPMQLQYNGTQRYTKINVLLLQTMFKYLFCNSPQNAHKFDYMYGTSDVYLKPYNSFPYKPVIHCYIYIFIYLQGYSFFKHVYVARLSLNSSVVSDWITCTWGVIYSSLVLFCL